MTTNLCSERGVKPRLARDFWQQCERDTPPCDNFYTKGNKFSVDMRPPKAYDAPHSHALPETFVHNRADLTQPHRTGDTDTESVRGQSPEYEGGVWVRFLFVGKTA